MLLTLGCGEGWVMARISREGSLFQQVIRTLRARGSGEKIADSTGASLSGSDVLLRALLLRRILRREFLSPAETHVAILLPPTAAAAVANLALALDRRVTVNLNYTLTPDLLNACLAQAGITHVVTSKAFLARFPLTLNAEFIHLEDLRERATSIDKVVSAALAKAAPEGVLLRTLGLANAGADELLTIIFTSGTTGVPKGVMLSRENVASNLRGVDHIVRWKTEDVIVGVLPFFHSFGSTITLWGMLTRDVKAVYHTNPLEAKAIGQLVATHRATVLPATPMFLRAYLNRADIADLRTLDVVAVGAEKMPLSLADDYEAATGVRPFEGYGMTEMSPLVSANVPKSRLHDPAWYREGTVGRPIPGTQVRVVDPETFADLPSGEQGMLLVTGPGLMLGYLGNPAATATVVRDGWYVTGDIASVDADGFITLHDRLSRFSKIAGEMVPHGAIEEALATIIGPDENGNARVAVTSIPDDKRGERLVIIHTVPDLDAATTVQRLAETGLPKLYLPAAQDFVLVEVLPIVGAGKLDLKRIRQMALEARRTP